MVWVVLEMMCSTKTKKLDNPKHSPGPACKLQKCLKPVLSSREERWIQQLSSEFASPVDACFVSGIKLIRFGIALDFGQKDEKMNLIAFRFA